MIRRFARGLSAVIAIAAITLSPLRLAAECAMVADAPAAAAQEAPEGHEGHEGHEQSEPAPHQGSCPDAAGCSPVVGPVAMTVALEDDARAASAPIAAPVARAAGPVASLEPPPPRR